MRGKLIQIIIILVTLTVGVLGTLYYTSNNETQTSSSSNVTITEEESINSSIEKVYDSVVVVETATSQSTSVSLSGSGFVYKKDGKYGYVMTNYHVVEGATTVKVVNMDGTEVDATYLGGDSYADIAVLRIDADAVLDVATIGDSTTAELGDTVFAVGTPVSTEYMGTVTKGIISGEDRTITVSDSTKGQYMMEVIQTDASINPGNSGGPLVNINGEVIGITSMKLVTDSIEGMGFAIPIEIAMSSVDKLEAGEEIQRPYIGVSMYDISNTTALERYNVTLDDSITSGVIIAAVESGSPAEEGGLEQGDVVTEVDGTTVNSTAHFKFLLYKHEVGDSATLTVYRNGKTQEITIKLTESSTTSS